MNPKNILIIEDETSLLETLRLKLEKEQFHVEEARDGKTGLQKIQSLKPDIILLDLLLPIMKGEEVLKTIKQDPMLKNIPVIIISNSGQPIKLKELLELGADDYIIKANLTINDILERVYNVIAQFNGRPDVLLAEDEIFLRDILARKLRKQGLRVITALDGDIALRMIQKSRPRVILLDLLMPGRSGLDILKILRDQKNFKKDETTILVFSNFSGKEKDPLIQEMTQGYFIKSNVDIDSIIEKIKSSVRKSTH